MKGQGRHQSSKPVERHTGLVVSAHGRHVVIESPDGSRRIAHPKGKRNEAVVGDLVEWLATADEGRIEAVLPRRNLFYRQDEVRTKPFAANLDQLLIMVAAEPEYSERQLTRALVAAEAEGIHPVIALNKQDLTEPFAHAWGRLQPYRAMGYTVVPLGLHDTPDRALQVLQPLLQGRRTLVLGPSGSGKSTLINALIPGAHAQTNAISTALNSGKHTTTTTQLYWLDRLGGTAVLDSPGFQEFGLHHIKPAELAHWMPDLRVHLGECRFPNCTHRHEPGCQLKNSIKNGIIAHSISEVRYQIYCELFEELNAIRHWG